MKNKALIGLFLVISSTSNVWCKNDQKIYTDENVRKDSAISILEVEIPRIDYISVSNFQPQETDTNVIWYDNFDEKKQYMESTGNLDRGVYFGETGASMKAGFSKGAVNGEGNRKVAFGDFPSATTTIKKGKNLMKYIGVFTLGWNMDGKAPAKMSRATSIVSSHWKQAMISHVWSGKENTLTLDPARGVEGQSDQIKTTKYNDFGNLTWLGNKPTSEFKIFSTEESGCWILVEARVKLNTPGKNDGINQLWIDGRLEAERLNLNFRGSYTKHSINAVFLESYWNTGSLKTQGRWFDNFVISSKPIGPVTCPANPKLYKTPYCGAGELETWEVEISSDYNGSDIVYKSKKLGKQENIIINIENGRFSGSLNNKTSLQSGKTYYASVRQKSSNGKWSEWSRWHQGFRVE